MLSFATRKVLYNRCDPNEPLDPGDARNVDVDAFGQERVRGVRWVDRLAEAIELSDKPELRLFTGLPGSGKSTELRRLAQRLARPDGANLVPVVVDGEDTLDLTSPLDVPDILASIVHACDLAVLEVEGRPASGALQDGYLTRFWTWLTKTEVEFGGGDLSIPSGGSLVVELKTRPTLRARVRGIVASHLSSFLAEVHRELAALDARAKECGRAGLVVIYDSLEKLRGTSTTWHDVLASAEQLFAGGAPYLKLPVHVIYTLPPALIARRFERVHFMPMIKLRTLRGEESPTGFAAARAIVARRIPDEHLHALLGPDAEARIRRIILWSGGYPRELVALLRAIISTGEFPLPQRELDRVLNEVRDAYRKIVPSEAFPWLARVATERYLTHTDDEHRPAVDLMLSNNVILRYVNDHDWYDLHPAVYEIPGIQAAIAALSNKA